MENPELQSAEKTPADRDRAATIRRQSGPAAPFDELLAAAGPCSSPAGARCADTPDGSGSP